MDFLVQFYQPYFFYSIFFLSISLLCVELFLKFNPNICARNRSILYLIPLFAPVLTILACIPQTRITLLPTRMHPPPLLPASIGNFMVPDPSKLPTTSVISITGLLCIAGAVAAAGYLAVTMFFGQKIAMKSFHVVMLSPEEYEPVQATVKEISRRIGVPPPKVGLIDDLRPNAFTLGYGRRAVIVFSLGILKMLNVNELTAVVSHELAHMKGKDYMFRIVSSTLNILSFFNPLSYVASSLAQQERELLADEKGASLLSQPNMLPSTLAKLEKVLQVYPKDRLTERLSTSLFLVSPIMHRPSILAVHPQIAHRVSNINKNASLKPTKLRVITISLILILAASAVSYGMITLQAAFQQNPPHPLRPAFNGQSVSIIAGSTGNPLSSPRILFPLDNGALAPSFQINVTTIQTIPALMINGSQPQNMP
jgi:heat shock protein HtpX